MSRPAIGDDDINWDKDAEKAAKSPYPYTDGEIFEYFKDLIKPYDQVLEVGCQIASWIWAWRDIEPTIGYVGIDFSSYALKIARERYGVNGRHDLSSMKEAWVKWWLLEGHKKPYPPAVFYLMNAKEMTFKEEFDVVFTHTFLQHTNLETKKIVVPKMWEALKLNGLCIIQEKSDKHSKTCLTKEEYTHFFEGRGFKLLRFQDVGGGGTGFVFKKVERTEER